ncbi:MULTISPECIES: hypothetical protein [Photorhabdus]|uniref:Uncharacterized protein n=1 Tax=Photorhabdus bodei TaxID=2029681 RepID=A0AAW6BI16_9GAMM|nr:hypothetical protein [Photorhabdus bodei]MDB6373259.1 hypothetical protein [Photorhabdus bodei]
MTGVSECSQQRGNLKDDGYNPLSYSLLKMPLSKELLICLFCYS